MSDEVWKDIKGFSGYQVSNKGQISSWKHWFHIILKPLKARGGYYRVCLFKDDQRYYRPIHRLVLETFVGPCPKGYETNHKDGIKGHNFVENLEWITPSENVKHAFSMGLRKPLILKGENHPQAKLKGDEVWLIKRLLWFEWPQTKIAKMFKVNVGIINFISQGRTWIHIKFKPTNKDRKYYKENLL